MLISGQCQMVWTSGECLSAVPFPTRLVPTESVCLARPLASERDKKPVSQRKLGFWGCFVSAERGGVKRLVVSAASAMSSAWVWVSYYTNVKLVKKDLCIPSNYFSFFFFSLSAYFHIWLTHTKTICKELEEWPSHNSPLCGEVTAVLVIQFNETAEHDSSGIKNMFK